MMNGYEYTGMDAILAGSFRAAIYCRLSKDDDLDGESASIANQRDMLESYCEKQGWEVVAVYQDDGYTGLNMERPDLKRMLKAIERRQINLVITKDLSRLGRNYLQTGTLIEDFFPRHGVRYIAMNDGIDTMRDNNDIAPFKNILNEMYSKDISKKVHSSYLLKAQQGQFTGCVAPFGYRKDPEDKNHLLVDEETAPIVRQIFLWALEGHGPNFIRRRLEEQEVPCPTWWNRERGFRNVRTKWEKKDPENGRYMWDFSVIKDILMNPVYTGAIASQKKDYRFKIGTIGEKKPQDWIVVEERHEPLIDSKSFAIVQDKLKSRQRPRQDGETSLFAGLIKCGECGKSLTIRTTHAKHPQQIYACKTYGAFGKNHCTQHRVEYDTLYHLVLNKIRECAKAALTDGEANANDLNTALYEKMAAEQDKYRDWLKSQPPEEILHHTYEYTIREDIVMAMEEVELTDAQAQALLESPSPLADVYRYFEKLETGHMDVIRDSIENRADDVCRAQEELRTAPLYPHSAAYASEHGEMAQYNRSYQANSACKEAIEQAISAHYAENRLDTEAAVKDVLEKFGAERVQFILANTIQHKNHDGRISQDNKAWAKTIPMPEDSDASRHCAYLVVDGVNPGLTDLFTRQARKTMQEQQKSSVLQKLKQEPPARKPAAPKKQEPER